MKFLGQHEALAFLRQHPARADTVRAWLAEIRNRNWPSAEAMAADFRAIDATDLPRVVFDLDPAGIQIETLVDFRNGVVLLTGFRRTAALLSLT